MSDDYLWNRSGQPDPDVEALEGLLGQLRYRRRPGALPPVVPARPRHASSLLRRHAVPLALAATIALLVAGTWVGRPHPQPAAGTASAGAWTVAPMSGTPSLGSVAIDGEVGVPANLWLVTDADSTARLSAGEVGTVDVGPRSRLRVVRTSPGEHRLALVRGSVDAFIWASPGQFFVETPSAVAIDLGCAYRLEVDEDGSGRLRVTAGWVGFELNGRESLVPHGALCTTRPGRGPGTPHFEDATREFTEALATLDDGAQGERADALETVLREARPRDALSLWHLLTRLDSASAARVYDRLAAIAPPPQGASKNRVLGGDREALDAWWDSFGLGAVSQFRYWMGQGRGQ